MGERVQQRREGSEQQEQVEEMPARHVGGEAIKGATTEEGTDLLDAIDNVLDDVEANAIKSEEIPTDEELEKLFGELDDMFREVNAKELVDNFVQKGGE